MAGSPIWAIDGVAMSATPATGSLANRVSNLYYANYSEGRCYPTMAAGATVVSAAANWAPGGFATIVPVNTIGVPWHISAIVLETCSKDGVFELAVYYGGADTLMATIRYAQVGGFFGNCVYLTPSVLLAANAQIRAKLASSDGFANQCTQTISVIYRVLI
jgi:hypothetical protein